VAEGVKSCQSVSELAKMHGVEMPIVEHVAKLIAGEMDPATLVKALIARDAKHEVD
jgi:glycerol-3-phosphate dehydrogenase (NAD(P)+)